MLKYIDGEAFKRFSQLLFKYFVFIKQGLNKSEIKSFTRTASFIEFQWSHLVEVESTSCAQTFFAVNLKIFSTCAVSRTRTA